MKMSSDRREFLLTTSAALLAGTAQAQPNTKVTTAYSGKLCFFSKPLVQMGWQRLAQNVKHAGFTGIDLTVRPGGHVKPERVVEDLPKAIAAIQAESIEVPMITTALISAKDPIAQPILSTAGKLAIPYYKPGYYKYAYANILHEQEHAAQEFRGLIELSKQHKMQVGYHNHSGYIGGTVWDFVRFIEPLDSRWAGFYFDPHHAVAEGGAGGWKSAQLYISPRIKMVAVKDFFWEKTARGWSQHDVPLGEGMVDWKYVFQALAQGGFQGPISLHIEYATPGKTPAEKEDNLLAAAARDLEFLKAKVQEAYGAAPSK